MIADIQEALANKSPTDAPLSFFVALFIGCVPLTTNLLATSLVGYKAWQVVSILHLDICLMINSENKVPPPRYQI